MMPGSDSEDSGFGDDLALPSTQNARIGSAGSAICKKTQTKGAMGWRAACLGEVRAWSLALERPRHAARPEFRPRRVAQVLQRGAQALAICKAAGIGQTPEPRAPAADGGGLQASVKV